MLRVFDTDATIAQLTDWVEVDHLLSGRYQTTDSRVIRADSIDADDIDHGTVQDTESGETVEVEILDERLEDRRDRVAEELRRRESILGDRYPFVTELTKSGGWKLQTRTKGEIGDRSGRTVYVAALLMSCFRHRLLARRPGDAVAFAELVAAIPSLFQTIAVFAATNLLGGFSQVHWFGFPRYDHSNFRDALESLINRIGHGTLKDKPPYNTHSDKDATVDVVVWRSFPDATYGSVLLFGQVASGNNWPQKPISTHIKGRFFDHFIDMPSSQHLGATFIPFVMNTNVTVPADGRYAAAVLDNARQLERVHGILVDRLRLAALVAERVPRAEDYASLPTLCEATRDVIRWTRAVRRYESDDN